MATPDDYMMMGEEDPELLKMSGSTVLEPMQEGQLYANMPMHEATAVVKSKLILKLGPENYTMLILALQVLGVVVVLYVGLKIVTAFKAFFNDPAAQRIRELEEKERQRAAKKSGSPSSTTTDSKSGNHQHKQQEQAAASASDDHQQQRDAAAAASASSPSSSSSSLTPQCKRSRQPSLSAPTSTLKNHDLVSVCMGSPCSNILVVSERAKLTTTVYAQHKNFVSSLKTTLNVIQPLAEVDKSSSSKSLVTACFFSPDGRYFGLYDVAKNSLLILRNDTSPDSEHSEFKPSAQVTYLYSFRVGDAKGLLGVPRGRNWGSQFAVVFPTGGPNRVSFYLNDGCVMLYGSDGNKLASAKRSLGNTVAWGVSDGLAACSGSTMSETCLYRVKVRESGGMRFQSDSCSLSLERFGPTLSPASVRISHIYLSPDSSTLMMLPATESVLNISFLYNSDLDNGDAPKISIQLRDEDFLDPALRDKLHFDCVHFAPNPTFIAKKVAFITLRIGGDIAVYRVDTFEAMSGNEPKCLRVAEIHGAHDDSPLIGTAIVGRGRGIMTATESDARKQLRCWELHNKQ